MQQYSNQKQQLIPNNVKYYLFLTEVIADVVVDYYSAASSERTKRMLASALFSTPRFVCCSYFELMCSCCCFYCCCCCCCFSDVELELSPNYATQRCLPRALSAERRALSTENTTDPRPETRDPMLSAIADCHSQSYC